MPTSAVLPVYIQIVDGSNPLRIYTDPEGTIEWGIKLEREVLTRGVMQFHFIPDPNRPGRPAETADLYIIPQTVENHLRRDSPFHRPEDPVHFIEDPGWGASDPANLNGRLRPMTIGNASGIIFAGEVPIRGIPPGMPSPSYKFGIYARGDRGRWINGIDPTVIIRPS